MEVAESVMESVENFQKQTEQTFVNLRKDYGAIPEKANKVIQDIAKYHIDSFNWAMGDGLYKTVQSIHPVEFSLPGDKRRISLAFGNVTVNKPLRNRHSVMAKDVRLFPSECRQGGSTYNASVMATVTWTLDGREQAALDVDLGEIPVMVKSNLCHLNGLSPKELVKRNEEAEEFGGYFIINGNEKILRLLIQPRQNYPLVLSRPSWKSRGAMFTEYGVTITCVAEDQTRAQMVLHFLKNGSAKLMFSANREMFFFPVVLLLKALCNYTDFEIFQDLMRGREHDIHYKGCILTMLRQMLNEGLYNRELALKYIGKRFRNRLGCPDWYTDQQVAEYLLKQSVAIHLQSNSDKFNLLVVMTKKLFAAVQNECALDSSDTLMNQEVTTSGVLYLVVLRTKLLEWLAMVKTILLKKWRFANNPVFDSTFLTRTVLSTPKLVSGMSFFLATGNLVSQLKSGLQQTTGFSLMADRLNYLRFISHFRSVHRGAFYSTMRTTTIRKLLPEQWGFVCPVHTPDGTPCGLLNHLTSSCKVVIHPGQGILLPSLLFDLGMIAYNDSAANVDDKSYMVLMDGKVLGYFRADVVQKVADKLRCMKATNNDKVPQFTEICLVPHSDKASQYPGLYLFTESARLVRPVLNLATNTIEYVGTFESVYLNIAVTRSEAYPGSTTHLELKATNILSILANNIPLSDFNQSPRNMYQCQMSKQTMGTPSHAIHHRYDNKLYRLMTPSTPLFRPQAYDEYQLDEYPSGTNAIVAVISYTGYDMEDAMIISKSSFERGFTHAVIYKNDFIDLSPFNSRSAGRGSLTHFFGCKPEVETKGFLDSDGLPIVGTLLNEGDPYYCKVDLITDLATVVKYKSSESAYVEAVTAVGDRPDAPVQRVCIRLRIPRNPTIGDKYASRHGQKGVCSHFWAQENMPFTESGMTPDIIFNPHGFPSRMTIGMMIESMAGKSSSLHGLIHDATPFRFSEECPAIEHFGELLEAAGYNYYGTEKMYSGTDGREMKADIFFGVVYYQKLRHMVSDKFQVRSKGTVDALTHQPVKGRKRAGGIRFGEMERDSLLAHGTSFLLQDRLFNGSDRSLERICTKCGGLLPVVLGAPKGEQAHLVGRRWMCLVCESEKYIEVVAIPFVFRYLVAELTAANIRVVLKVK